MKIQKLLNYNIVAFIDKREMIDNIINPEYNQIIYIDKTLDNLLSFWKKLNKKKDNKFHNWIKTYGNDCIELKSLYQINVNNYNKNVDIKQLAADIENYFKNEYLQNITITNNNDLTKIKCITTNEVFNSITEASQKYHLDSITLKSRALQNLNIGVNEQLKPLYWEIIDELILAIESNMYYLYELWNITLNIPVYIGFTKNIIYNQLSSYINQADTNWILTLYRLKYSNYQFELRVIWKSSDINYIKYKTAEVIYQYAQQYILFNKQFNITYQTKTYQFILNEFNLNLYNINEAKLVK